MTTTNGFPSTPPVDLPPRAPTRHLVVDVRDGEILLDSVEPTQDDVIEWLRENGGTDMLTSEESARLVEHLAEPPRVIPALADAFAKLSEFEPVRLTGPDRNDTTSEAFDRAFGVLTDAEMPREKSFGVQCPDCGKEWGGVSKIRGHECRADSDGIPVYGAAGKQIATAYPTGETREKAGGKMPSQWIREWCAQEFPPLANDSQRQDAEIAGIVAYLNEQWRERGGR
jgi:hypothetical protein